MIAALQAQQSAVPVQVNEGQKEYAEGSFEKKPEDSQPMLWNSPVPKLPNDF